MTSTSDPSQRLVVFLTPPVSELFIGGKGFYGVGLNGDNHLLDAVRQSPRVLPVRGAAGNGRAGCRQKNQREHFQNRFHRQSLLAVNVVSS